MSKAKSKILTFLEEDVLWAIERWLKKPGDILREIKWFIQRGKRGWADCDAWNLNFYLSDWLPDALKNMKKYRMGCPGSLGKAGWTEKQWGKAYKKWDKILDQIIAGFEAAKKQDFDYNDHKDWERLEKIRKKGMDLFVEWYHSLWW